MRIINSDFEDFEGSGDIPQTSDVILKALTMTPSQTSDVTDTTNNVIISTTPSVTSVLSSVIKNIVSSAATTTTTTATTTTTMMKTTYFPGSSTENATSSSAVAGVVSERLFIFVGVFVGLVCVALGIFLYIKFVHEKRPEPNNFLAPRV